MENCCVVEVFLLKKKRLPDIVIGQVPEVLRRQSHLVDGAKLRVSPFNHVLFGTLHSFFSPYQKVLIALVEETFHPP